MVGQYRISATMRSTRVARQHSKVQRPTSRSTGVQGPRKTGVMKIGDDQFGGLQIGVPGVGSADNKADHKVLGGYMNTFNQEEHDKRTGKFKKDTSKTAPSFHREESIDGGYKHPDPTRPDPTRPDPTLHHRLRRGGWKGAASPGRFGEPWR